MTSELTVSEREVALEVARMGGKETRRWLNLVLEAYDGRVAELERVQAKVDSLATELAQANREIHEALAREARAWHAGGKG